MPIGHGAHFAGASAPPQLFAVPGRRLTERSRLIGRWFAALSTKELKRSAHRNVKELAADIIAWAAAWNENPRPFVWTKSAEQILERLAGYCAATNTGP